MKFIMLFKMNDKLYIYLYILNIIKIMFDWIPILNGKYFTAE